METPKKNIMVCVVYEVPEKDVLEQMTVYPENVVFLGLHHPSLPEHSPCPDVLLPWGLSWEEAAVHFLQSRI